MAETLIKRAQEDLGLSNAALARALGVDERRVRRWLATDSQDIPDAARALLWLMMNKDRGLAQALMDDFRPAARAMPEPVDRFLWAIEQNYHFVGALQKWLAEDQSTLPFVDATILALLADPGLAASLRNTPNRGWSQPRRLRQHEAISAREEREREQALTDPSDIPGLSLRTYRRVLGRVRIWVAGGNETIPASDPAWPDMHAALKATYEPGINETHWSRLAINHLIGMGYEDPEEVEDLSAETATARNGPSD